MTLPFVSGSRASIATPHVDPANVPLPASRPSSRRSSAAGESSVDLPKLADQGKRTAHPQTRRGIGALPPALHLAIADHLPLADVVSFAKTDKQINGALRDRTNHLQADYVTLSGHIDAAQSLADLHTIANSLHRDTVQFETVCAKIGLKISRMIGTITVAGTANALPDADRAAEIHRCLSTYAQMEPAALRAAGLGRAIGMAKSVPTADHQGVFDEGVAKMKATVPASERGPVLNALIAVTTTSDYDGTGPASERVAANIGQVLENMDGLSDAAKTQLVMTAMKQTKELCEPGWSEAMRAVGTAYQKLHAA